MLKITGNNKGTFTSKNIDYVLIQLNHLTDFFNDDCDELNCTLTEADASAPQYCQKCGVCVHAVSTEKTVNT